MQYESAQTGRMLTIRLSDNEPVYESVLSVARKENIRRAVLWIIGGAKNAHVIVGPEQGDARPVKTVPFFFSDSREILGMGTIFPDESGHLLLHIHAAFGKNETTITGCPRIGLDCWLVAEIIMLEIRGGTALRKLDENGFHLLTVP